MNIRYQNYLVRKAKAEDAILLMRWWNDGSIMAHAGFPYGLNITEEKIAQSLKTDKERVRQRLIIELDNYPIGEMSYQDKGNDVVEIGIKICDKSKQNAGAGKIYLSMLINHLFNEFMFRKIYCDTDLRNERSQRVYEQLGFKKKNVVMNSWENQLGELCSAVEYELELDNFNDYRK